MSRLLLPCFSVLFLMVGCAAPADESEASVENLGEARVTAEELEAKAEAHFNEVEASKPNVPNATSTILFAVDDDAPVQAEGEDQLEDVVTSTIFEHSFQVTAKTSPVFYVQSSGAFEPGTHACADIQGGVVLRTTELFRSGGQPCTLTITKAYRETISPTATLVGVHPRLIVVGHVAATVKSDAGTTKDVRAGFVLTAP